jgi:hypothetical protein
MNILIKMTFDLIKSDKGYLYYQGTLFVGQNDIWHSQKWQGVIILCKYPKGLASQNGTWPSQKR